MLDPVFPYFLLSLSTGLFRHLPVHLSLFYIGVWKEGSGSELFRDLRGSSLLQFRFPGSSLPFRFAISVRVTGVPPLHRVRTRSPLFSVFHFPGVLLSSLFPVYKARLLLPLTLSSQLFYPVIRGYFLSVFFRGKRVCCIISKWFSRVFGGVPISVSFFSQLETCPIQHPPQPFRTWYTHQPPRLP